MWAAVAAAAKLSLVAGGQYERVSTSHATSLLRLPARALGFADVRTQRVCVCVRELS